MGGSSPDWGPGSRRRQEGVIGDGSSSCWLDHHDSLGLLSSFLKNGGANTGEFKRRGPAEKCPDLALERTACSGG